MMRMPGTMISLPRDGDSAPSVAAASAARPKSGRLPSLDGWRGISILLVLGSHAVYSAGFPFPDLGVVGWLFDGELGVRIFFILSGFIITRLLVDEARRTGRISLRKFYARRVLRIVPVYVAFLAVLAVIAAAGWYRDDPRSWLGAATFTRNLFGRGHSATAHLWSLAIEQQFYLLWPLVLIRCRLWESPRRSAVLIGIVLLLSPLSRVLAPHVPSDLVERLYAGRALVRYADSLAIGCAMALLLRRGETQPPRTLPPAVCLALLGVIAAGQWLLHANAVSPWAAGFVPGLQDLALGALILHSMAPSAGWVFAALNQRALVAIGVLSYSLYIWHMLFLSDFMGARWASLPSHAWTTWWIAAFATAALSYRFVERPFLRLRKAFSPALPRTDAPR